jgi:hypothetical protein
MCEIHRIEGCRVCFNPDGTWTGYGGPLGKKKKEKSEDEMQA